MLSTCKKLLIALSLLLIPFLGLTQKKTISHETYDEWNHLENVQQSPDGQLVVYQKMPLEGDGTLHIKYVDQTVEKIIPRGVQAKIHHQNNFVVYVLPPQHDTIRKMKLDGIKPSKFPKDSLGIYFPEQDSMKLINQVKSFKLAEKGDWLFYLSTEDKRPKPKEKKWRLFKRKKSEKLSATSGTSLYGINPVDNSSYTLHAVTLYEISRDGSKLVYVTSNKNDVDSLTVWLFYTNKDSLVQLHSSFTAVEHLTFNRAGDQLLFLSSLDTVKEKNYSLYHWKEGDEKATLKVDSTTTNMPGDWTVSHFFNPYFSRDGSKIYLGTNEIRRVEEEDTLLAAEQAKVDIWGGEDLRIQPEQLKNLPQDKKQTFEAVYHVRSGEFLQIETNEYAEFQAYNFGNANFGLLRDGKPFRKARNWEFPWKDNYYKINLEDGSKQLLVDSLGHIGTLSPSGDFFIWYEGLDSCWYAKDINDESIYNLTGRLNVNFASDNNGMPFIPYPEGASGWAKYNDEEFYIVKDFYDVWMLHPTDSNKTFCLTNQKGRKEEMRYRLMQLDRDSIYISLERVLIHGINDQTKDESIYKLSSQKKGFDLKQLVASNHSIVYFDKAESSDRVLLRRSNFQTYPDLEATSMAFEKFEKLTNVNPQQEEYKWGTVEFVDWYAYDSTHLRGLLYKPEDFDPNKKYPMIVYFYEQYQDNIHTYYAPRPTASIVYPTEYVSNDYIIFIPDIRYKAGHPAKSAFNCIVSGTDYLIKKHDWIDSTRLGLQGQSWGGYQTAQLVTMTDKYAAAMAGAPVSNMFSAYGGIRWGSGMSRMFQYERTQSRIGYTIWERPDLYIENSPIFGLPEVSTPLLIMHNDRDGAVPWYQGIELYMGLRRLGKDVWLLNYNQDAHNLRRLPNKRDLSIRMRQFFDHYLQGAPMPVWMKSGVPAVSKGKETGYETEN